MPFLLLSGVVAYGYEDGAPAGHTGGFGEPDCSACHADSEPNPAEGSLRIEGLPHRLVPDAAYDVAVILEHPGLRSGGFQLAMRSSDGNPAGQLVSLSGHTRLIEESGQVYLQHTREGLQTSDDGTARWRFRWIAPGVSRPVHLHVAANAANDDISALGDYIFTLERVFPKDGKPAASVPCAALHGRAASQPGRMARDQSGVCPADSAVPGSDGAASTVSSSDGRRAPFRALIGSSRNR